MPYSIRKQGDKFAVIKDDDDKQMGEHDTREDAERQIAALEANEEKQVKMVVRPSQQEVGYIPLTATDGQACANCRWFTKEHGDDYCHLIENHPLEIMQTGWCNRWESVTTAITEREPAQEPVVEGDDDIVIETAAMDDDDTDEAQEQPSIAQRVAKTITRVFGRKNPHMSAFKAHGEYWFARWSNNFEDRDGEFFSEKAIEDYFDRVNIGVTPLPELWLYHVPGSKVGQAQMVGGIGHFVVAVGTFDDTPQGRAAKAHFNQQSGDYAMSHGFTFDREQFVDNVYHQFNTFEITVLPRKVAANPYTSFDEVKRMKLTDEKAAFLRSVLGADADAVIAETQEASKAIEQMGVNFKDFVALHDGSETEAVKEAAKNAEQNVSEMVAQIMTDQFEVVQASAAAVKAVQTIESKLVDALKAQNDTIASLQEEIKALRSELDLRPRSVQTDSTSEVDDAALLDIAQQKEKTDHGFDPFPGARS